MKARTCSTARAGRGGAGGDGVDAEEGVVLPFETVEATKPFGSLTIEGGHGIAGAGSIHIYQMVCFSLWENEFSRAGGLGRRGRGKVDAEIRHGRRFGTKRERRTPANPQKEERRPSGNHPGGRLCQQTKQPSKQLMTQR